MLEELTNRANDAVELGRRAGADEVWAVASRNRSVQFAYRDTALESVEESTSRSLNLKLFVDGRYSTHSTTDLDPSRLENFVRDAVAMTRLLEADPFREITDPALFEGRSDVDLDLVDPSLLALDNGTRESWCTELVESCRGHEQVISAKAELNDSHSYVSSASSNGFQGQREGTSLWLGASVTLQGEGERRPEGDLWVGARHQEDLPPRSEIGAKALDNAVRRLGSIVAPTRHATMVVDPRAGAGLLSHLMRAGNARLIQQSRSFWADFIGLDFVSDQLSLTDDPLIPRGLASRLYDGEGIAARAMPIFESGRLSNVFVDTYYGRKASMTPTTGGASNLVFQLGDRDLDQLISDVGDGIYVTSWLGGNSDTTTGDFSRGFRGHLIENGAVGQAIGEMNIAGNLQELFRGLTLVGNDPWPYSTAQTPTLVFDDVQFSGI